MQTPNLPAIRALRPAWNKGRIVGQKLPLKPKHVWAIRVRLELAENHRDLALFNLASPQRPPCLKVKEESVYKSRGYSDAPSCGLDLNVWIRSSFSVTVSFQDEIICRCSSHSINDLFSEVFGMLGDFPNATMSR